MTPIGINSNIPAAILSGSIQIGGTEVKKPYTDLGFVFQPIATDSPLELVLFDVLKARMRRSGGPARRTGPGTTSKREAFRTSRRRAGLSGTVRFYCSAAWWWSVNEVISAK